MAETVTYVDSLGTSHTLSANARYLRGDGVDVWHVEPVMDELYGEWDSVAGYDVRGHELSLEFAISASSYDNARATLATWRQAFMRDVSRFKHTTSALGTLVVIHNGGTYTQWDVANATPEIRGPDGNYIGVTLKWQTRSPFWKYNATASTVSAFASTTPVWVSYSNTGDYDTWPIHKLTGACGTPTITDSVSGDYIQIGTAWAGTADQVWVWTNPPLIRYYAGGTAAGTKTAGTNLTGYAGTVSTFFELQVGAGSVSLYAASGSAAYTLDYDILKAGLG